MKEHHLHVHGMHCKSCVILIEETLIEDPRVQSAKVDFASQRVSIQGKLPEDLSEVIEALNPLIESHGYRLSLEAKSSERKWRDFLFALPIAALFMAGFYFLQKIGLVNLISGGEVSYPTALLIGFIASLSTCLAVVGGLVLSMSAEYAKEGDPWKPQALFHVGRLIGFFILGGVIGALGKSLEPSLTANLILGVLVAGVMLLLGVNLLDLFHFTKKWQPTLPKHFSRAVRAVQEKSTHEVVPVLVGAGTFFLPCGFTQSMQLYTLSTGSFLAGGLTMLVFALGTFPVLALLSFSSFTVQNRPWKGVFFKTAGLIVIALALFNLINTLVLAGWISPVFNF